MEISAEPSTSQGITIRTEEPNQADVIELIRQLDAYQAGLYPEESSHLLDIKALCDPSVVFLGARKADGTAVGCGAVKLDPRGWGEIKRMYVVPAMRGPEFRLGQKLLAQLETIAFERGFSVIRLETGIASEAALAAYHRAGFRKRPHFGDYIADPLSVFMEKTLGGPRRTR